ncbi:MAG: glycoside hydrolase family 32 protein [Marinilabiliales bacterium]|nr:glycoside hydrolase family 32 protein [Marinilabiliales bacterium]
MKKNKMRGIGVLLLLLLASHSLMAQFNPHGKGTDYREHYRGQFHFSPQTGWMNDINGIVWQGGQFHMIYQWGKNIRHGGYATSPDLLHWRDRGVALIPQKSDLPSTALRNVSGEQVYSGSAVVVSGAVAKGITGSEKEAIVAIYTGTGKGTCLAWSNDGGEQWHDYPNNPVANRMEKDYPRDPHLFWFAPQSKFVMAIYENGTTFYGSKDLLHWEFLSNLPFGFECPDIYPLPLDGDPRQIRWVLQDANGSYLVGDFDGTTFKPEQQPTRIMDVGPDFYAAQSFQAGSLPNNDPRIIQLAWMDHWNGGIGEVGWERNATFPVSLGLVSVEGEKRITRQPIRETASLYQNDRKWGAQRVPVGKNLLEGIRAKQFDLTLEVDLSKSKALTFGLQVANDYLIYDNYNKTLLSKSLTPDARGHVRIRLLVDWGQLEVFGNDGRFSYTQQFAFAPDEAGIRLFTDGDLAVVSLEFHELKRCW